MEKINAEIIQKSSYFTYVSFSGSAMCHLFYRILTLVTLMNSFDCSVCNQKFLPENLNEHLVSILKTSTEKNNLKYISF